MPWLAACFGSVEPTASGLVDLAPPGEDALSLTYLGNGGWILERGGDVVVTAPLFSNPELGTVIFGEIHSDSILVDAYLSPYGAEMVAAEAILVGHAHYDHLLDVPRTALRHATSARVVGSTTVANLLGDWSGVGHRVDPVEEHAGSEERSGKWMKYGRVRIMPLLSNHGSHYAELTLFPGSIDAPLFRGAPLGT